MTPTELAGCLRAPEPPALLDVREIHEHAFVSLPGARLVPLGEIQDRLAELDDWRDREIVVYCHHGVRSQHAGALLREAGFARVVNLSGGIDRWSREVDPAVPRY
jgi:rhodanese-related sulfurtransferase